MRIPVFALALVIAAAPSGATTVAIANGTGQLQLRVGATGATISTVAFAPAAAAAGDGTPVNGTTNAAAGSAQGVIPGACPANNVRVWARARSPAIFPRTATLQVNGSINLTSGGNTIPLTNFDWVASGGTEIASAAFSGSASQVLMTFGTSNEVGVCLLFRFLNTTVYPSGTYTGQITYTLTMV